MSKYKDRTPEQKEAEKREYAAGKVLKSMVRAKGFNGGRAAKIASRMFQAQKADYARKQEAAAEQ